MPAKELNLMQNKSMHKCRPRYPRIGREEGFVSQHQVLAIEPFSFIEAY